MTARTTRVEGAGSDEQRELLLEAAFEIANGNWPVRKAERFNRMLDAEAYLSAAEMLVPGKAFVIDCATQTTQYMQPVAHVWTDKGKFTGKARTPALALLAAILRAGDAGDGSQAPCA